MNTKELLSAAKILKADMLDRAENYGQPAAQKVVACGNSAWIGFCEAIEQAEKAVAAPKPEASDELIAKGRELLALREKVDAFELERNRMFGSGLVPTLEWEKSEAAASDNLAKAAHELADWIAAAMPMLEGKPAVSADDGRDAGIEQAAEWHDVQAIRLKAGEANYHHQSDGEGSNPYTEAIRDHKAHAVAIRALKSKPSAAGEGS